ncbi:hypothetical protein OG917_12255 [Streptomyces sp. NBC_00388]
MIRRLTQALAWSLATGAATTLTWWGVHSVMAGTAYDPPRALPVAGSPELLSSATQRPEEPGSASPGAAAGHASSSGHPSRNSSPAPPAAARPGSRTPSAPPSGASSATGSPTSPESSGDVRSYTVSGGRVVFDLGASSAGLVSATPSDGWQMQVWKQPQWIRVTFTKGRTSVSVFCTWNGHKPSVEVDDH